MSFKSIICLTLVAGTCFAGPRGQPAQEGIGNFGKVGDSLFRGAQPDGAGIQSLKRLGVKLIINLRQTNDVWQGEAANAWANGIDYTNVPLKGLGRPTKEEIQTILSLIESSSGAVFVHCQHGCDRTGTVVACYRMHHDHWTSVEAMKEASQYGISRFERGMKKFVAEFGKASISVAAAVPAPAKESVRQAEPKAE
jgi:protein tyrosine/serine phosphatase